MTLVGVPERTDRPDAAAGARRSRGRPGRRPVAVLLVVFALTRLPLAVLADHPEAYYRVADVVITGDTDLYERYAERLVDDRAAPYADVRVEYPPGALAPIVAPRLLAPGFGYRNAYIALMLAVDALGLLALLRLGRRWGSLGGAWLWVALVPLLGPLSWARFDLVPAVLTIWAFERAAAGRWRTAGAVLGAAIAAKLYPVLLLPALLRGAPRRRDLVLGVLGAVGVTLVPFAGVLPDLAASVGGYHAARGLQIESVWSTPVLYAAAFGAPLEVDTGHGALHVIGWGSSALRRVGSVATFATAVAALWLALRAGRDVRRLAAAAFATLALALATTTVLSPQFLLWLIALGALTATDPATPLRQPLRLLVAVTFLTQLVFPTAYARLEALDPAALVLLGFRNVLLVALAVAAVRGCAKVTAKRSESGLKSQADRADISSTNQQALEQKGQTRCKAGAQSHGTVAVSRAAS